MAYPSENPVERNYLDKTDLYVYTYYMTPPSQPLDFTSVSQVPLTCMGMHVRRASRVVTQHYDEALRPIGLVLNQFTLLVALHLAKAVSVTRLAQELCTDQTTLTRNLKLLEKRGLIAIAPGRDRRVRLASLTPEGQHVLAQALPLWEQAQTVVQQRFGQQKTQALLSLLSDLTAISQR
jgi:DNA-binding MarR family transcriptional regulator